MLNTQYKVHNTSWTKFVASILGISVGGTTIIHFVNGFDIIHLAQKTLDIQRLTQESVNNHRQEIETVVNSFTPNQTCFIILLTLIYHASNLYDQYNYNKSLEHSFDVKINGEVKTINASPQEWDSYTIYNSLLAGGQLLAFAGLLSSSGILQGVGDLSNIAGFLTLAGRACFSSDYNDFNFKDNEGNRYTAEEIEQYLLQNNDLIDCN